MRSRTLAQWLAFLVPFVAYLLTCSGHAYWLDSGEFVAASVRLDIAHPPGHPLSLLYGKAWSLVPLGPIAFRVALGQAFATALAACFVSRAIFAALEGLALGDRTASSLSVFGAWLSAVSYGLWFQAVRPEVYALQTLCMSIVIERICTLEARGAEHDARPLMGAALALGLGLANHHLIAFLTVPALLPTVLRVLVARGVRPILHASAIGLLALCTYAYLPLRAATSPAANLGDPSNWERFSWVVSARVYAREMGSEAAQAMHERFADVLVLVVDNLHAVVAIMAVTGLYVGLRQRLLRRHTLFVGAVALVGLVMRAWLGLVRANPDILGYLGPAFVCVGMLAAFFLGALVHALRSTWTRRPLPRQAALALAFCLPPLALLALPENAARASLAKFAATDGFDELRVRRLPPRATVVATSPQTVFRQLELDAVEAVRPDVALVDVPFLRYPNHATALAAAHPDLAGVLHGYFQKDVLRTRDLLQLAERRPTFVEIDSRLDPTTYPALRPEHELQRVRPIASQFSERDVLAERTRTYAWLYRQLASDVHEVETARQLLWVHYMNSLYFAALGSPLLSRFELERAERLAPNDANVQALRRVLPRSSEHRAIDVRPLLEL